MSKPFLAAGYTIEVSSWENDADNPQTKRKTVSTREEAEVWTKLVRLWEDNPDINNIYEPNNRETTLIQELFDDFVEKHLDFFAQYCGCTREELNGDRRHDACIEMAHDLGLSGGDYYTRDLNKWKVLYTPVDIHMEDVTAQFKT